MFHHTILRFGTALAFLLPLASAPAHAWTQDSQPAAPAQDDAAAAKKLAQELQKAGRKDEAIVQFKKTYELAPTLENGLAWARSLLDDQRYNDTLTALESMMDKFKKEVELFRFFAEACEARAAARAAEGADSSTVAAEYEAAARSIEDALALKPGDPDLLAADIRYLILAGKAEEAIENAEGARKLAPSHWGVAMWHGDAIAYDLAVRGQLMPKGEIDAETKKEREAKVAAVTAAYAEAAKFAPERAEPRQRMGAFLLQTGGDKSKAMAEYVAALGNDPSKVDVSAAVRGMSPKELKDLFTKAQDLFRRNHPKTAESDPIDASIWWYLGYAKYMGDDRKGAAEAFTTVTKKSPTDMTARYYLGRIHALDQKWKDSIAQFEIIAKKSPKDLANLGRSDNYFVPTLQLLVSKLLSPDDNSGQVTGVTNGPALQTAILFTRTILEVDPRNVVEWNNLGLFYRDSGDGKEALHCYKKALEYTPNDPRLLNDTAVIYHYYLPRSKENDAEAKALYERAIDRAKQVLADKASGAIDKENAKGALTDAQNNLRRLQKGDHTNN
jgi:tetratricopeptide (TPR) repeat protein